MAASIDVQSWIDLAKKLNPYNASSYGDEAAYNDYLTNAITDYFSDFQGARRTSWMLEHGGLPGVYRYIGNLGSQYSNLVSPLNTSAQANADAASSAETSSINDAIQSRQAGINANVGRARAGLLGDSSANTNTSSVYNNAYQNSIQNNGATQADYLNKMGQADAMAQCAQNMKHGAFLNALGSGLMGASSGASLGSSLGGK